TFYKKLEKRKRQTMPNTHIINLKQQNKTISKKPLRKNTLFTSNLFSELKEDEHFKFIYKLKKDGSIQASVQNYTDTTLYTNSITSDALPPIQELFNYEIEYADTTLHMNPITLDTLPSIQELFNYEVEYADTILHTNPITSDALPPIQELFNYEI
ncbi:14339_t:CDS:2, partial [Gigaspora margarita]